MPLRQPRSLRILRRDQHRLEGFVRRLDKSRDLERELTASENIGGSTQFQIFSHSSAGSNSEDNGLDGNHCFYVWGIRRWVIELDELID